MAGKITKDVYGKSLIEVKVFKKIERVMAALFVGTDEYQQAYCLIGGEILNETKKIINGKEEVAIDPEVHLYAEFFSRVDETFTARLKDFLKENMALRALVASNNEKLAKSIIKDCMTGGRIIPFCKRDDCSIVIQRAYAKRRSDGSLYLNKHRECVELKSANYYPVRHCTAVLLEYYDKPARTKVFKTAKGVIRHGY